MALSAVGGLSGAGIALAGLSLWRRLGPADFPRMDEAVFDIRVFAFAVAVTLTIALICAAVPAHAYPIDAMPETEKERAV